MVPPLKLRSHMRGAVAERRRADFDIPAPLPRVRSHIRGADAGGSAISWGQWWFGARGFEADAANWVLDPFLAERILLPVRLRSATAHVWTHVMICAEDNFPPASARVRPCMCERTLTHWGRVTHICVGKLSIIGSDNGSSPGRRQAIIWTNAVILLVGHVGTNFSENWNGIETFSIKEMHLKMSSAKWRLFGLGLNELRDNYIYIYTDLYYIYISQENT